MADVPPPSLSELMRMVAELQQANQRMADENQIMAAQIAELNHARIEHNDTHRQQAEDEEHQSQPTHVSETARHEGQQPEDEKEESEDPVGPFIEEVMNFELPKRFTLPLTLTPYDGLGDPRKFLKKFRSIMIVNGSISRFHQLAKLFEEHFAGSAIYLHDSDYLNTIKQGPNESLKEYMTRFTKVAISIPDLHPEVHLHAIKSGLRPGKFQETIAVAKPKILAEFREKAKGQIDIEELRQARKSDKSHFREEDKNSIVKKSFKLTPRFDSYTQFNTKREDIIKEILNSKLIKPPRKAGTYQDAKNVDKSKYCAFHQKHGHNTDDCVVAKDLLERLARQGHLDKYIGGHIQKRGPSSTTNDLFEQHREKEKASSSQYERPRGIINCISGGYAGGGYTNSARKRSFRAICSVEGPKQDVAITNPQPEVTFTQADFNSNIQNLDDPVVITLQIWDLLVKKVLLDPGSSVDVLFYSTFQKMKLSDNVLQSTGGDLVGFSGERVPILGSVWLQTTLGEQPLSKTNDIQYLVVDCFNPYNIILGRPFLNKFGAIVSTVHLCVKFPLQENQVGTIHGDHKEARQCYNISMKFQNRSTQQVNNVGLNQKEHTLAELDPRADFLDRPKPSDDLQKVYFNNNPNKFTYVGTSLNASELQAITTFLQEHADLFAWTPSDMPGIDPHIISHKLAINSAVRPVQQKKRKLGEEKRRASLEETQKLINAEFIKEIRFTTWLANVNAGATYQRLMDKVFAKQIGRNIEVYVDDMVAKMKTGHNHISDLTEIFGQIRQYNMRLNPEKCAFAVQGGKFLGFLLTCRGIEANPDKCRAVLDMASPKTVKEVQRLTGRLAALSRFIELSEFDIRYQSRGPIKSQFLADFIAEFTTPSEEDHTKQWILYVDGSSNNGGCGAGIRLEAEDGFILEHSIHLAFKASNNQSEYEALLAGLRLCLDLQISTIKVYCDYLLVVQQLKDWRDNFIHYLQIGNIPEGVENDKRFRRQASSFTILNGTLYRRGYTRPLLKCLNKSEADIALAETHEGICGTHTGAQSLASKILRAGFFWPTLKQDSQQKIRSCQNCQRHAPLIHIPAEQMHHSEISWPFNQWSLDILGPFPTAPGQVKFLIVGIDYFSKWVEAQPLARITSQQMISFIWKNIICRFGIPQHITTDNGRQFADQKFQSFLQNLKINQHFASVEHPQTNGLAEAANKVILHALKKKLDDAKGLWAELIPEVLWGYNTTPQTSTKETPFRLVYGSEAMIPLEISQNSIRTCINNQDEARRSELDIIEEIRDIAALKQRAAQQAIARQYNKSVRSRSFVKGDLVLRKTETARKPPTHGKLVANWDGPYRISKVLGQGAYKLESLDGKLMPNTWNVSSLKKFYS
ncbi:uncharacterized protein [Arachis hypogaea]|uniref:uncharacterized protein n=1 Tax=Arachis hypogaea TaxID=3818 RepID=UPI003B214969